MNLELAAQTVVALFACYKWYACSPGVRETGGAVFGDRGAVEGREHAAEDGAGFLN